MSQHENEWSRNPGCITLSECCNLPDTVHKQGCQQGWHQAFVFAPTGGTFKCLVYRLKDPTCPANDSEYFKLQACSFDHMAQRVPQSGQIGTSMMPTVSNNVVLFVSVLQLL